jgi:hypothetical protein
LGVLEKKILKGVKMILICFLGSLLVISCSTESAGSRNLQDEAPSIKVDLDSINPDSSQGLSSSNLFTNLIEYPEDIILYKSRKKGANNGGGRVPDFCYKPDSVGFYLGFLLFYPEPINLRDKSEWFDGLRVSVYRFGTEYGHYRDSSDIFISLKTKVQEPELRSFNLVGKSRGYIKDMLGDRYVTTDGCMIYSRTNKVLVINFKDDKVAWFKYTILQKNFREYEMIPAKLLVY